MSDFVIRLRPGPSEVPEIQRLRSALKSLGRSYQLRAISVQQVSENEKDLDIVLVECCRMMFSTFEGQMARTFRDICFRAIKRADDALNNAKTVAPTSDRDKKQA